MSVTLLVYYLVMGMNGSCVEVLLLNCDEVLPLCCDLWILATAIHVAILKN
jgi:hypothetical protein